MSGQSYTEHHRYGTDNVLQDLYVYLPTPLDILPDKPGYWVVYIHGGAWRDPEILAPSFSATQTILSNNSGTTGETTTDDIVGYASINYRLTAHPQFPQARNGDGDGASDAYTLHNAIHPDHLHDVRTALCFLHARYAIADRYVLVGHSCGATLAFQAITNTSFDGDGPGGCDNVPKPTTVPRPLAIVSVAGIHDLRLLRDTHADGPVAGVYQRFIADAFGSDERVWDAVSPARVIPAANTATTAATDTVNTSTSGSGSGSSERAQKTYDDDADADLPAPRLVVLARSTGDDLVDEPQLSAMGRAISDSAWCRSGRNEKGQEPPPPAEQAGEAAGQKSIKVLELTDLRDGHDDIWRRGVELAGVIGRTIGELKRMMGGGIDAATS